MLLFRGLRREGLGLRAFAAPPDVLLSTFDIEAPTSQLGGVVRTEEGAGIAEALVLAAFDGELAWTYTDAQGEFLLEHLPPRALELEVVARKFRTQTFPGLTAGDGLELVLTEPVAEVPELLELERSDLDGLVASKVGKRGLLGYEVVLLPARSMHLFGEPVPVRATVGADRAFHFEDLIQGDYRVVVLPPWARGGTWPNLCESSSRTYVHGPSSGELELPLASGEIFGRVLDSEGQPVHGAFVVVTPSANNERPWPPASSDPSGAFELRDLPPGAYDLKLHAGEASWQESVIVLAGHTSVLDLPPLEVHKPSH